MKGVIEARVPTPIGELYVQFFAEKEPAEGRRPAGWNIIPASISFNGWSWLALNELPDLILASREYIQDQYFNPPEE